MKRLNPLPLWIALAAGPLVYLVQHVARPAVASTSPAWLLLGPLPNLIVGLCVPFLIVAPLPTDARSAPRAFTSMTLATLAIQVIVEIIRPARIAETFDLLDIVASVAGMFLGALLYRRVAPHLRYSGARE